MFQGIKLIVSNQWFVVFLYSLNDMSGAIEFFRFSIEMLATSDRLRLTVKPIRRHATR